MTDKCLETLKELRETNEAFEGLSAEQLILEAIRGTGIEDVRYLLKNTDWEQQLEKAAKLDAAPAEPMNVEHYSLEIEPAIDPAYRHKIEDTLKDLGFEIIGGGQNTDGSGSDISFERPPALGHRPPEPLGDGMTFGRVMEELEHYQQRVARRGWNGKGMWLALQKPDERSKMTLPYVYMKTADGALVPWLASQTDILAEDWFVVEEKEEGERL